jgi:hypothetical protein
MTEVAPDPALNEVLLREKPPMVPEVEVMLPVIVALVAVSAPVLATRKGAEPKVAAPDQILPDESTWNQLGLVPTLKVPVNEPVAALSDPAKVPVAAESEPVNVPVAADKEPAKVPVAALSDPPKEPVGTLSDPANVPVAALSAPAKVAEPVAMSKCILDTEEVS